VGTKGTFPLVDRILDGQLAERLTEWRAAGDSYASIVYKLRSEHDVTVSIETVRRWLKALDAEAVA